MLLTKKWRPIIPKLPYQRFKLCTTVFSFYVNVNVKVTSVTLSLFEILNISSLTFYYFSKMPTMRLLRIFKAWAEW